jgi:hypothetical protein
MYQSIVNEIKFNQSAYTQYEQRYHSGVNFSESKTHSDNAQYALLTYIGKSSAKLTQTKTLIMMSILKVGLCLYCTEYMQIAVHIVL